MSFDVLGAHERARARARILWTLLVAALALIVAAYGGLFALAAARVGAGVPVGSARGVYVLIGLGMVVSGVAARAFLRERARLLSGECVATLLDARRLGSGVLSEADRTARNVLEEVAVAAGLAVPSLYVLDHEPGINALAVGTDAAQGAVFVTAPATTNLGRDALQAVVAHEVSHLAGGDAALHAAAGGASAALRATVRPGLWIVGRVVRTVGELSGEQGNPAVAVALGVAVPLLAVGVPVWIVGSGGTGVGVGVAIVVAGLPMLGALGWALSSGLALAVAKASEFASDASALELTRHPEALADAIRAVRDAPMKGILISRHASRLRPFFFTRPDPAPPYAHGVFEAHPTPEERLTRLGSAGADGRWRRPETRRSVHQAASPSLGSYGTAQAAAWLAALPPVVYATAHDAERAEALVYALLLDADPAVRRRQWPAIPPDLAEAVRGVATDLATAPPASRLPVMEIAFPALRALPEPARGRICETAQRLARADGRLAVSELAMVETVRAAVLPASNSRVASPEAIVQAASVVLAAVSSAGAQSEENRTHAFEAGSDRLAAHVPGRARRVRPTGEVLSRALDALRRMDMPARAAVLDAALAATRWDGRATLGETDLVRMLALALGLPSPSSFLFRTPSTVGATA